MFERNRQRRGGCTVVSSGRGAQKRRRPIAMRFARLLEEERKKIAALSIKDLFAQIDADRRKRFEMGQWVFTIINLDRCAVWPGMGGEDWARVRSTRSPASSRRRPCRGTGRARFANGSWKCTPSSRSSSFARAAITAGIRIEDGSHRAIAYYLAGFKQAFAYVARVPSSCNLTWKWEG